MAYKADPGGNFASDVHRRVAAHLPLPGDDPTTEEALFERLVPDEHTSIGFDELGEVLSDLEADGDAARLKDGWKQSKQGHEVLSGPIATDGGRSHD